MGSKHITIGVFVIGGSPAILTETLAAYAHHPNITPPTSMHIITTSEGKKRLIDVFFTHQEWQNFIAVYPEYTEMPFHEEHIQVAGNLADISNDDDNRIMMDSIFHTVQNLAHDETTLLASIAGGRKTMSYYLGLAMSLFAKEGDSITHVIVPPEWEHNRDFLFPSRQEVEHVNLIETPFIRLQAFLSPDIKKASVQALIESTQSAIDIASKPQLTVNYTTRHLTFLGKTIQLPIREFVFLRFFLQQKRRHCIHEEQSTCGNCHDCYLDWEGLSQPAKLEDLNDIRTIYASSIKDEATKEFAETWDSFEAFKSKFPELKNRLNTKLKEALGIDARVQQILLKSIHTQGYSTHGLGVDKSQIQIEK